MPAEHWGTEGLPPRGADGEHDIRGETPSEDEDEPCQQSTREQKKFPPEVKTVNMIHVTKRRSKHALRDIRVVEPVTPKFNPWSACPITFDRRDHPTSIRHGGSAVEPVTPKFNPWSACPITFDRRDHPTSIRHGGSAALVLDPVIDGYHLTRVLMDGGPHGRRQ